MKCSVCGKEFKHGELVRMIYDIVKGERLECQSHKGE